MYFQIASMFVIKQTSLLCRHQQQHYSILVLSFCIKTYRRNIFRIVELIPDTASFYRNILPLARWTVTSMASLTLQNVNTRTTFITITPYNVMDVFVALTDSDLVCIRQNERLGGNGLVFDLFSISYFCLIDE